MKTLEKNLPNLKPVYRLTGDDAFVIKMAFDKIENACKLNLVELNKVVFDDETFNADKIILSCQQLPIMSDKRLVIVKNVLKVKDADIKKLNSYCEDPAPDTVLVFEEVMGANVFAKLIAEKVLCKKLTDGELQKIITAELYNNGKEITTDAAQLLIDFCGHDLLRIKNELTKLIYCGEDITAEVIKKLVKKSDDFSVFEISTALTYGQGDKAIVLMNKMLETTEFPIILGLISSHFRRMLYASIAEGTNTEIAEKLGVKEFAVAKAKTLAKSLQRIQILKINDLIFDVDYDIKSGKMATQNAMFYLVFAIVDIIKGENK